MNRDELYIQFDSVFFEKTRLSILTLLYKEEVVTFNRFKKLLEGTDGGLYAHLKKLIDAKYIAHKKSIFNNVVETRYSLTKQGRDSYKKYLSFLEATISGNRKGKGK